MLRIGEFAALSSISISMLRNYDKIGLLVPEYVDSDSGYRYYDREQLVDANKIVSLKNMGLGLDEIRLAINMSAAELKDLLVEKLEAKQKEIDNIQHQVNRIKQTISYEDNHDEYALSVVIKHFPEMNVVGYRKVIHKFSEEGQLWNTLNCECVAHGIKVLHEANGMTVQHEINIDEDYSDIEVMLEVTKEQKAGDLVTFHRIGARDVAAIVFKGSYGQISAINIFFAKWLEDNDYEICGEIFYIYHRSPHESRNVSEYVTELCFPIKKKSLDSNTI